MADEPNIANEVAREALARNDWATVYEQLNAVDASTLNALELNTLADSAFWLSRFDDAIAARQKAYTAAASAGDDRIAGVLAGRLSIEYFLHEELAIGMGFLGKAQRHLRDVPECVEQGYLAAMEGTISRNMGRFDESLELARKAVAIGERFADQDLLSLALHVEGVVLVHTGRVRDGLALMDESMTSVLADEVSPFFAGIIYCELIGTCLYLGDIRRAGEWSDASMAWCETLPDTSPYLGMCRVNRAEVARLRGAWIQAEEQAARAADELLAIFPDIAGSAHYQIGEIRRRRGDLAGAEAAYARSHELGGQTQPGLPLLRLAQGKADAATAAIRTALAGDVHGPGRARLLVAQIEIALAVGDTAIAREALDELRAMAMEDAPATAHATLASADGAVLLAESDVDGAAARLHDAVDRWHQLKLPYDTASARVLLGRALAASGDEDGANLELRAAIATFEQLGARPDLDAARASLGDKTLPRGLTAREAEVLRLVSAGKTNRDIAVELVISEHTVSRHIQNLYAKIDVSSRAAATAFAFEHGLA